MSDKNRQNRPSFQQRMLFTIAILSLVTAGVLAYYGRFDTGVAVLVGVLTGFVLGKASS